ncbi:MAG: TonB-dependent receptor [Vicinamibacterales bacterium]
MRRCKFVWVVVLPLVGGAALPGGVAAQSPATDRCALHVQVVDTAGAVLDARIELVEATAGVRQEPEDPACIRTETSAGSVRLLVSAAGFQAHATDAFTVTLGARREVVVTLAPPFAETLTVSGRTASLVGVADSASAGVVGAAELASRPLLRGGDLIEAVPGVAMTQHSSGGHAPIILLRGYNLDHGTDFATALEGVPLNLPSHAHAQGYTDTNFLIGDLVRRIEFQKGPYSARTGNFSTAGAANIELVDAVDAPLARVEAGGNGFGRVVGMASFGGAGRRLLLAGETSQDDGPSVVPDDFGRIKGLARYSSTSPAHRRTLTFSAYRAAWTGTDGYPQRALDRGYLTRFGTLDAADGGRTQQHMFVATDRRTGTRHLIDTNAFLRYYDLDLFSNLTFWTMSPTQGDQIWQADRRLSGGGQVAVSRFVGQQVGRLEMAAGLQARHDAGRVRLRNTVARVPVVKQATSGLLPATTYDNAIAETSVSPYTEVRLRPATWLRVNGGARVDTVRMRVRSDRAENSGTRWATIATPKGSVVFGPWRGTEFYMNAGLGFHSNHAGGVMQRVDPVTGTTIRTDGTLVESPPPLVRTRGAETGLRAAVGDRVQSSVALWLIDSDSELLYTAEDGVTSPERPGRRYGLEWLNVVRLSTWLTADLDAAWSSARYRTDPFGEGRIIPDAASAVIGGGVLVSTARVGASLRGRYLGRRALRPDGRAYLGDSFVVNGQAEIRLGRRLRLSLQAFNLFDQQFEDAAYYYATRLRDPRTGLLEADALHDVVTRPGQPRTVRAGLRIGL